MTDTPLTLLDAIREGDRQLDAAGDPLPASAAAEPVAPRRFVLLSIASGHFAIPEAHVTELERVPRITLVPHTPEWMLGVTNVRGDIVSVIDMHRLLHLDSQPGPAARLLVVRLLDEPFTTGLIVDGVDRIVAVNGDAITAPAAPLEGPLAPFLAGVCEIGDRLVAVLDIDRFLRSSEIRQFEDSQDPEEHHA